MKKILFTGGGSAGHVVPNIALMEELLSDGETDVCYMGTSGIEKRLISEWKIPFYQIECPKLVRGKGWRFLKENWRIPLRLRKAVKQAKEGLELLKPDAVFSKGGFVALPVVLAARKLKIPCFAHESDFSVGLANKLTARRCRCTFTSFPETAARIKRGVYSGAPIRRSVFAPTRAEARRALNISFNEKVVLVFGGGSGSETLNRALRARINELTEKYTILHICGKNNTVKSNVRRYLQFEFISDMGMLYAASDMVVSRAGAGTAFEILALRKPALFVPLEKATRGDQLENAAYFQRKGLCRVLRESSLEDIVEAIDKTLSDEDLKTRLSESNFTSGNKRILERLHAAVNGK
ncbi:MAG: UDP-N-acetylglucosamine--N-acetylmuramyl-(pentapeptide) pyrophosphoryl-undecaprenol N-acetylglucosamine transferase [Clostridia bacterium]|nr:UDP-N-acetylglucosamine--N-acetylmuramyl-(pentapeptide) pyrophosphoryl-undecaprenol N-acetylglucosamine transferase [Clostridia bacterium]